MSGPLTRAQNALIRPGAVFLIEDNLVVFPKERLDGAGARKLHDFRWVIVLQGPAYQSLDYPLVNVVACSASSVVTTGEFQMPQDEMSRQPCAFDKPSVVAFTNLVQPCLKIDLKKHMGDLLPTTRASFFAQVVKVLGLVNEARGLAASVASPGPTLSASGALKLPARAAGAAKPTGSSSGDDEPLAPPHLDARRRRRRLLTTNLNPSAPI